MPPEEETPKCRWCGSVDHGGESWLCPYVKALEFDPTTYVVTRVEFLTPLDYPQQKIEAPIDGGGYERLGPKGPQTK